MADITKLELVQHSMNSIRAYLDDILKIQHQIDELKERSKELAFRAKDESRIISIYFNDEEFKQSLRDDFVIYNIELIILILLKMIYYKYHLEKRKGTQKVLDI